MNIIKNNRGVAIIYITLFLLILGIVFVAWAIDVGWMVFVRSQGQAGVDAAALRGAAAIPNYNNTLGDDSQVKIMAKGLDSSNTVMNQDGGVAAAGSTAIEVCSGSTNTSVCPAKEKPPAASGTSVRVTRTYSTPLFFSRLLSGGGNTNITVSATAYLGGLAAGGPDLPGAIRECALKLPFSCQARSFTTSSAELVTASVDLVGEGLLHLLPETGSNVCDMAAGTAAVPEVQVGQRIAGGGAGNCFYQKLKERYCTEMTGNKNCDGDEGAWCYVTMPVVDCQGLTVTGFATMCITKVQDGTNGTKKLVEAVFCCSHTESGPTVLGPTEAEFYGTYADRPVLVR